MITILTSINFGPEYNNYPKEYKVYNNLSHAMIFVMLLLQYFVAVPLTSESLDGKNILELQCFLIALLLSTIKILLDSVFFFCLKKLEGFFNFFFKFLPKYLYCQNLPIILFFFKILKT